MVNSQLVQEVSDAFKIDERVEKIPNALPVVDVTPKFTLQGIVKSQSLLNGTSVTIYRTPVKGRFWITGANIAYQKDATATSTSFAIAFTPKKTNVAQNLISLPTLTLVAGSNSQNTPTFNPIEVKPDTDINITSATNVANFRVTAQIYGFLDEVN